MRSMTAFVYGSREIQRFFVNCSLASFNSRFLDIQMTIPEEFHPFKMLIYDMIKEKIRRGRVEISIYIYGCEYDEIPINFKRAKLYIERLRDVKDKLNLEGDIDLAMLTSVPEFFQIDRFDEVGWKEVELLIKELLEELIEVKKREGEFMKQDIEGKLNRFKEIVKSIQGKAVKTSKEQKGKILSDIKRLKDLDINISMDDIKLFAFKGDVDEELVRLSCHVSYFSDLLKGDGGIGRRLLFLLQEMFREVNTVGSKAHSADIVHRVIDLKELLDETRELVENIE